MAHGASRPSPQVQTACLLSRDALLRAHPRGKQTRLRPPRRPRGRKPALALACPAGVPPLRGSPGGELGASGARRPHVNWGQRAVTWDLARGLLAPPCCCLSTSPAIRRPPDSRQPRAETEPKGEQRLRAHKALGAAPLPPHLLTRFLTRTPRPPPRGRRGRAGRGAAGAGAGPLCPEARAHRVPKGQRDAEAPVPPGERAWPRSGGPAGWGRRRGCGGASKPQRDFCEGRVLGKALLRVDETGFYFWPKRLN